MKKGLRKRVANLTSCKMSMPSALTLFSTPSRSQLMAILWMGGSNGPCPNVSAILRDLVWDRQGVSSIAEAALVYFKPSMA